MPIFVRGNVPSSKNSKQWTGKFLVSSKTTRNWEKSTKLQFQALRDDFLKLIEDKEFPIRVEFTFIRDSRRKFDYVNPLQTIQDAMVKHGWIPDDNCDIIIPSFGLYKVDKENSGVWLKVL
jgi:hypothetical protein